jgi:hypothetical protein
MTLIALTFLPVAFGQSVTATLVGTVRDNSGAAINDAEVPVNTTTRLDGTLQPGSVAQTVTVSDQAPLLQTDRADVSAQIESKQVEDLPIGSGVTRNFQSPESLMPGVSPAVYDQSLSFNAQHSPFFQVNGRGVVGNNLTIEGVDDDEIPGFFQPTDLQARFLYPVGESPTATATLGSDRESAGQLVHLGI